MTNRQWPPPTCDSAGSDLSVSAEPGSASRFLESLFPESPVGRAGRALDARGRKTMQDGGNPQGPEKRL